MLLLTTFAPSAWADEHSPSAANIETPDPIVFSGRADLEPIPLLAWLHPAKGKAPAPSGVPLATANRIEIDRYTLVGADVRNPERATSLWAHYVVTKDSDEPLVLRNAKLQAVEWDATGRVAILPSMTSAALWPLNPDAPALIQNSDASPNIAWQPAGTAPGLPSDPRRKFLDEPASAVQISNQNPAAFVRGTIELFAAGVLLRVTSDEGEFLVGGRPDDAVPQTTALDVARIPFIIARIAYGEVRFHGPGLTGVLFTPSVDAPLSGTIRVANATGHATIDDSHVQVNDAAIGLTGDHDAQFLPSRGATPAQAKLRMIVVPHQSVRGAAAASDVPAASTQVWAGLLPVGTALGAVAAVSTVAAVPRLRSRVLRVKAPLPQMPSLPPGPDKAGPSVLSTLESQYRKEPGNIQLALELGMAYFQATRYADSLPLLLMSVQNFPRVEGLRYTAALALLKLGRVDEAVQHLDYSFRLNPLNVARFVQEGPGADHGANPRVRSLLQRWSRIYHEASSRGYA